MSRLSCVGTEHLSPFNEAAGALGTAEIVDQPIIGD